MSEKSEDNIDKIIKILKSMKNINSSTSTPNILDSRFSHMTPMENYRKGPLLLDVQSQENMIQIINDNQSIKSPTIYKSEISIMSPNSNVDQVQGLTIIKQKKGFLPYQESFFQSPDQKKKVVELPKWTNEFEEIPKHLDGFLQLIENQHSEQFGEQKEVLFLTKINHIHFLDNFYRKLIVIIYFQYILTIICLPYAAATNSFVIYYIFLLLRLIDVFVQIKIQFPNQKNVEWHCLNQCLQSTYFEIGQVFGIFCLIFLTHVNIIKWLLIIFVLLCTLPKIKDQELSLKLEFGLKDEQFSILLPIFRLCIYIHLLTCIWYGLNQDSGENDNDNDKDYWHSMYSVVSIISFNNQATITQEHQKICFAFFSLSSLFVLAYIIHQTKGLFGPSKYDLSQFQQAFRRVPIPLKLQMIKYCNENASKSNKNKKLILPTQIANKITFHDGFCQLRQFFAEYEESTLIRCLDLCQEIEGETEEVLLKEGQVDDCSIYFILQGKVQIVDRNCQIVFSKKETGQYFGEYAFYTQHPRSATVISDGCCRLLKLRRADFLNCLSRLDKQFFQLEQEKMMFSENYRWQCYCCNSYGHTINQCPQLTYRPKRLKTITQYIKESVNKRFKFRRGRITRHQPAWKIKHEIKIYETKMQYLQNEFFTPTSCLTSFYQLPYDENQRESVMNHSLCQSDIQSSNQLLEKSENKIDKVERKGHSRQTQITAGFGLQFPSKILTDSKMEIIDESLEAIDQQDFNQYEKSIAYSSPDCVESWAQQKGNPQNQKVTLRSLRSKSSKKQSTGTKSNFQSNFTPFSAIENQNEDNFDQMYNFQLYRPQSNLDQILQIIYFYQQ